MAMKPDAPTPGDQQDDPEDMQDQGADEHAEGDQPQGDQATPKISDRAANVFQRLFMAAKKMILQKEVTSKIMQMIQSAGPVDGIVRATMLVLDQLATQAQGVNKQAIYSAVLAGHVALQIGALAVKAGLMEDDLKKYQQPVVDGLKQQIAQRVGGQQQQAAAPPPAGAPNEQAQPQAGLLNSEA